MFDLFCISVHITEALTLLGETSVAKEGERRASGGIWIRLEDVEHPLEAPRW